MKISVNWLKKFLSTQADVNTIADTLIKNGLEVESIDDPATNLKDFVVAHVVECEKHPNADRLNLCQVDCGDGKLYQVVCGAKNVRKDLKVVFARIGTTIPYNQQVLSKGTIRGIESFGMICSAQELNLSDASEGIIELGEQYQAGDTVMAPLGLSDAVIDVSITPNRGDCFSILGIARELAASNIGELLLLPQTQVYQDLVDCPISVKVIGDHIFTGRLIRNVTNHHSPEWLKNLLTSVGARSISAVVDITNYLCLGLGRPLHAFDADKIQGEITVRYSHQGEKFTALNGLEYTLDDGMIVICDDSGIISLAGIMGGASTACDENTKNIFLESAYFNPVTIAQTGQKLNILSDARTRFERGVDAGLVAYGLDIATDMLIDICGGKPSKPVVFGNLNLPHTKVDFNPEKFAKIIGVDLTVQQITNYLQNLGIKVENNQNILSLTIPSWRHDLKIAEDIVEEIARLHGYESIPSYSLSLQPHIYCPSPEDVVRKSMINLGFNEVITWSFTDPRSANDFVDDPESLIYLQNPISQDLSIMRPSLVASMLKVVKKNHQEGRTNLRFFELAAQFNKVANDIQTTKALAGIRTGNYYDSHWRLPSRKVDVFDAKLDLVKVLKQFGIEEHSIQIEAKGPKYYAQGQVGTVKQGKKLLGYFGQIHPNLTDNIVAVAFELLLENILPEKLDLYTKPKKITLSNQPIAERDFSFIIPKTITVGPLINNIKKINNKIIKNVTLFDYYLGKNISVDHCSIAFKVIMQSDDHTLTEEEINSLSQQIINYVQDKGHGQLRNEKN